MVSVDTVTEVSGGLNFDSNFTSCGIPEKFLDIVTMMWIVR